MTFRFGLAIHLTLFFGFVLPGARAESSGACVVHAAQHEIQSDQEYRALLEILQRPVAKETHLQFRARWKMIKLATRSSQIIERLKNRSDPATEKVSQQRLAPSGTYNGFVNGDPVIEREWARKGFDAADHQVQKWIEEKKEITAERIGTLQRLLVQDPKGGAFRTHDVYGGGHKYLDTAQVQRGMAEFVQWIETNPEQLHPIELAARAYQRMVSIHPFNDANGRTSRMVMDWILIKNGLPPPTFENTRLDNKHDLIIEGAVAVWPGTKNSVGIPFENLAPDAALQVVTQGIERTLQLLNHR